MIHSSISRPRFRDSLEMSLPLGTKHRAPDVVALGESERKGRHKINLTLGNDLVVLTDDLDGELVNRWVLTAIESKKGGTR